MDDGDCDAAIAACVAAVTHVQSLSQEVGSGDKGLGLYVAHIHTPVLELLCLHTIVATLCICLVLLFSSKFW